MSYDHAKVQAWVARVPLPAGMSVFLECVGVVTATELWPEVLALVAEFRAASSWEQANMLYGLKDRCVAQMDCLIHDSSRTARREDEARDLELQCILMGCHTPFDSCSVCGRPFVHHQHPMKPPGVIISSTCGCTGETDDAKAQEHRRRGGAPPAR